MRDWGVGAVLVVHEQALRGLVAGVVSLGDLALDDNPASALAGASQARSSS